MELEKFLTILQQTEDEQEYIDKYKSIVANGEITEKARRLLENFRILIFQKKERGR